MISRTQPIATGRTLIAAAAITAAGLVAPPAQAQLELDGPPLPGSFFSDEIGALERQIADRLAGLDGEARPEALILTAQKNLRLVARQLLTTGREAGWDGSLASMYGLKIADEAAAFDELISPLPQRVRSALAQPGGEGQVAELRRAVDALKEFNRIVDDESEMLSSAAPIDVDRYLQRMLSPLAIVAEVMGEPVRGTAWFAPASERVASGGAGDGGTLSEADVDALVARVERTSLADPTKREMKRQADLMRRALGAPDVRPRVAAFYGRIEPLVTTVESLDRADWFDDAAKDELRRQAHTAVLLMNDRKTRGAAAERIDQLRRVRRLVDLLNEVSKRPDVPIDNLRDLFLTAYRLAGDEPTRATAENLIAMLERMSAAILRVGDAETDRMPGDIRRVYQTLRRQYDDVTGRHLEALPALAIQPNAVTDPSWTEPVRQMAELAERLDRLSRVPVWMERMTKFNPNAGRGLFKQVRLVAQDLLNPGTERGAAAALAEMEKQVGLFESLPYEAELVTGHESITRFADGHHPKIEHQLTVLRSAWAAAWAAGADPTPAGRKLLLLRRLLESLHDATVLFDRTESIGSVNGWAGWRVPEAAIQPLKAWLPEQLAEASRVAGEGMWPELEQDLDRIDRQVPIIWLIVRMSEQAGPAFERLTSGEAGMLSQSLYPPEAESFGASMRNDLAQLSVALAAADSVRQRGDTDTARRLMGHAGQIAEQLLEQTEAPAADLPEPGAAEKPPSAIDL